MDSQEHIKRWRLILGKESKERFDAMGGGSLSEEDALMDQALAAIYNRKEDGGFGSGNGAGNRPIRRLADGWAISVPCLTKIW